MYQYDDIDRQLVNQRVTQFRGQVERYLKGELSDDEFKQLRLRNGLYLQRHAHMLRVAIPYGLISTRQMRTLAHIADKYDRGYGHFTTRQNIQFNWPELEDVPDILQDLADVDMHAIQTSGNCIRNVTADHFAGVASDEIVDPRPYCEIIRQWSTLHPEFSWLPRKFKIAVTGSENDRAAIKFHDIGLQATRNEAGEVGFAVWAGGGMGRTPVIARQIKDYLPEQHLLSYLEAILRVYNLLGRRDNIHKARIKILINTLGVDTFRDKVEAEWQRVLQQGALNLTRSEFERMTRFFGDAEVVHEAGPVSSRSVDNWMLDTRFSNWYRRNTFDHKIPGYRIVAISLKAPEVPPGDITSEQMRVVADIADDFSRGEIRSTHQQNLLLTYVKYSDVVKVWRALDKHGLATPNIGTLNDMICCPGLDFCNLANAGSIDVAKEINQQFSDLSALDYIGDVELKMSGCMNACGHHHAGHIGILGVDKHGEEWYQFTLGGSADENAAIGTRLGPSVPKHEVAATLQKIFDAYLAHRRAGEKFIDTYRRIGVKPFKDKVYDSNRQPRSTRRSLAASG